MSLIRTICLSTALAVASTSVAAQTVTWNFTLSGSQEVPPVITTGTSEAVVELNTLTNQLMWHLTIMDLSGDFSAAHFHQAPIGVSGPAILDMTGSWMPDPGTARHGHMFGAATVSDTVKSALLAGNVYINVHTSRFPGGEIRGQVVPAAGAFALLSLGGMVAILRRR